MVTSGATGSPDANATGTGPGPGHAPARNTSPGRSSTARSSSSKRRGVASTGGSSSHVLRTTSTAAAAAGSGSSGSVPSSPTRGSRLSSGTASTSTTTTSTTSATTPSTATSSTSATTTSTTASTPGVLIAPPPRVALGSSASPDGPSGGPPESITSSSSSHVNNSSGNSNSNSNSNSSSNTTTNTASTGSTAGAYAYSHLQHAASKQHHRSASVAAAAAAAAASATAQLLKEKDLRIGQLERELTVMEAEFTRELDKLSKAESETATFWQAKHSRLQQQLAHADTTLRLLRTEVELREAERAELRAGWEDMQRTAAARDDEARQLRQQVRGLKEWVSASTRADGQVATDEVFGDGMARLANSLQNWVIVHFRRAKMAPADSLPDPVRDELARLVPMHDDLCHTSKLHLLQSAVSRLLVELVFDAYFVGLPPDQAAQLAQLESALHAFAGTAEPVNQWRALTLTIVAKDAAHQLQTETARVVDDVVARVNGLLDAITDAHRSDPRDQALRALVASAVDLSRLLVAQKAVFRVFMPDILPHHQLLFDPSTMDDIGGEDDDGLAAREIACVTFPGIIKRGDETGSHLQYRNVICKARVLCAPE